MPPADVSSLLEELNARVQELERRVSALERPSPWDAAAPELPLGPSASSPDQSRVPSSESQPSVFSVFGKAILGLAGAYLLRAAAESGAFPAWIAVTVAVFYAAAWLVWAAWPRAQSRLARHTYAITAALILSPLLWEATVRFQMLTPPAAAALLAAFALLAVALAWRPDLPSILWVGMLTAVFTSIVLMVAAHAPVPFTMALLFMAFLAEFAGIRGRWLSLRPVVALAADFAVLILLIILGDSQRIPEEYHAEAASVVIVLVAALFAIYAASLAVRSLANRQKIKIFEVVQLAVVAILAGWGVLRITQGTGMLALGLSCLFVGAACYFAAFGLLARHRDRPNFRFYAVCAVAFVTAGSFFALPSAALVIGLCLAALLYSGLGVRLRSPALDLHGVVYLSAAVAASGLLQYAGRALAGAPPPPPGILPTLAAATTLVCTAMVSRYPGEHLIERLLRLLPAILAACAAAALAVAALVWLISPGRIPSHPLLAVIRTVVTCAAALLLAFVGARWKRVELVWMAYAAAVLGSLKLLLEDLRLGSTQSLAASLVIYGAVLILIPRLVRAGRPLA